MSTPVDPDTSSPENSEERRDWATTLVDRVVDAVERLRSATTQPVITATRALVYGVLGALCLISAVVLASIGPSASSTSSSPARAGRPIWCWVGFSASWAHGSGPDVPPDLLRQIERARSERA